MNKLGDAWERVGKILLPVLAKILEIGSAGVDVAVGGTTGAINTLSQIGKELFAPAEVAILERGEALEAARKMLIATRDERREREKSVKLAKEQAIVTAQAARAEMRRTAQRAAENAAASRVRALESGNVGGVSSAREIFSRRLSQIQRDVNMAPGFTQARADAVIAGLIAERNATRDRAAATRAASRESAIASARSQAITATPESQLRDRTAFLKGALKGGLITAAEIARESQLAQKQFIESKQTSGGGPRLANALIKGSQQAYNAIATFGQRRSLEDKANALRREQLGVAQQIQENTEPEEINIPPA